MTKPIPETGRIRSVRVLAGISAVVVSLLLGAAGTARAANPVLTGEVGIEDGFTITLTDANGARVTHLDTGTYTLLVHDHSTFHNFHLSGPGNVDVQTPVDFVGDQTFTVTLVDGQYFFQCDPHSSQMKGNFTVGTFTAPTPKPPPPAPQKLAGTIGPGASFRLGPLGDHRQRPFGEGRLPPRRPRNRQIDRYEIPRHGEVGRDAESGDVQLRRFQGSQALHRFRLIAVSL
jgi:hypothetical protein